MTCRVQLAAVQLAVFVVGGAFGPVVHLVEPRSDHSHGRDGRTIAFALGPSPAETGVGYAASSPLRRSHGHELVEDHHHHHPTDPPRATATDRQGARRFASPADTTARLGETSGRPGLETQPIDPQHGHGSIAHLGLALLSAAPPLPLPLPAPAAFVPPPTRLQVAGLFQPTFPRPRPPPAASFL